MRKWKRWNVVAALIGAIVLLSLTGCGSETKKIVSHVESTEDIPYEIVSTENPDLWEGEVKVLTPGEVGRRVYYFYEEQIVKDGEVTYSSGPVDWLELSEDEYPSSEVTKEPVDEIVEIGTKLGYATGEVYDLQFEVEPFLKMIDVDLGITVTDISVSAVGVTSIHFVVENRAAEDLDDARMLKYLLLVRMKDDPDTTLRDKDIEDTTPEHLVSGESDEFVLRTSKAESIWPVDYELFVDTSYFLGAGGEELTSVSLSEFWEGTFHQE